MELERCMFEAELSVDESERPALGSDSEVNQDYGSG